MKSAIGKLAWIWFGAFWGAYAFASMQLGPDWFWTQVERYQTLIAGLVAISAAWVGLQGVRATISAQYDLQQRDQRYRDAAIAFSIAAEMRFCSRHLLMFRSARTVWLKRGARFEVYLANVSRLGALGPDLSAIVIETYNKIQDLVDSEEMLSAEGMNTQTLIAQLMATTSILAMLLRVTGNKIRLGEDLEALPFLAASALVMAQLGEARMQPSDLDRIAPYFLWP